MTVQQTESRQGNKRKKRTQQNEYLPKRDKTPVSRLPSPLPPKGISYQQDSHEKCPLRQKDSFNAVASSELLTSQETFTRWRRNPLREKVSRRSKLLGQQPHANTGTSVPGAIALFEGDPVPIPNRGTDLNLKTSIKKEGGLILRGFYGWEGYVQFVEAVHGSRVAGPWWRGCFSAHFWH